MANMMTGTSGRSRFSSPNDQCGFSPVAVKIDHHRIHPLPAKFENSLVSAARAQNIPAVLSQIRTSQIQTYRVVSDTENIVTMPRSHRYPYSPGLRCALSVGRRSRFMITRIAVRVHDRNHVWPKRVSLGPLSGPATRPFCSRPRPPIDFVTGKRGFSALKSLPHARVAHCRRLFPQRLSSV